MTTQQYVENIKAIFPQPKEAQIVRDLDTAQKLFAVETGMIEARGQLSSIATNQAWNLPSNFSRLTDVVLYDSNSKPKYLGDYNYEYEIEFEKFFIKSLTSVPITGLNTEIDTAYIHYIALSKTLASRDTALEIDSHFRDALEHYVLGRYFGKYPTNLGTDRGGNPTTGINLRAAQFHLAEYEKLKIKAKREINSREPAGEVQNYQHAGAQVLPRRINDAAAASTTTVQVSALSDIYSKYVAFTITSPNTVVETIAQIGYSTVTGAISGDTFTLSSTAEFAFNSQIVINNADVTYLYNSTSEIVFTFPSGWGVVAIEIYERV